jgi:hypothetical protein
MYYSSLFNNVLLTYLIKYRNNKDNESIKELGNYLIIAQDNLINKYIQNSIILEDSYSKEIIYVLNSLKNSYFPIPDIKNLSSLFNMTNNLSFIGNKNIITSLVDLAIKKEYLLFLNIIYNNAYGSLFEKWVKDNSSDKVSIIDGSVFVVDNLSWFLYNIRENGYNINGGPQKFRSQTNSLNNFLSLIDLDFRTSLYNHNQYHYNVLGNLPENWVLSKEELSFTNIHKNLGNTRW